MKPEKLQSAIGEIDELYIAEAHAPIRRKVRRRSVFLLAACLAVLALLVGLWLTSRRNGKPAQASQTDILLENPAEVPSETAFPSEPERPDLPGDEDLYPPGSYYQVSAYDGTELFNASGCCMGQRLDYGTVVLYRCTSADGLYKVSVLTGAQQQLTGYVVPSDITIGSSPVSRKRGPRFGRSPGGTEPNHTVTNRRNHLRR